MKTKALISFAVTAKLICVFVFAYAKSRFSHDAAHLKTSKIGSFKYFSHHTLSHIINSYINIFINIIIMNMMNIHDHCSYMYMSQATRKLVLLYEPQRDKTSLRTLVWENCIKAGNRVLCIFNITMYLYALNIGPPD